MPAIVGVHGIAQQARGPEVLEAKWGPALRDGARARRVSVWTRPHWPARSTAGSFALRESCAALVIPTTAQAIWPTTRRSCSSSSGAKPRGSSPSAWSHLR